MDHGSPQRSRYSLSRLHNIETCRLLKIGTSYSVMDKIEVVEKYDSFYSGLET